MARTATKSRDETGPYGAVEAVPYCVTASAPAMPAKKADTQNTISRVTLTPRPWVASMVGVSAIARRRRPRRLPAIATITAMQPTGGTNQAIGLAWGWHSLNQGAPLNAPAEDPNYTYKKAIILLSDGLNTEDRWPVNGDGSTQFNGSIDARQTTLCNNIKAQGITIYTIQVNTSTPPDATSSVLSSCASKPENFYLLYSATQVISAFNSIGTSLSKLRVAR